MSKTVTMNIRLDEDTRKGLKDFSAHIGIPATSLVNASIKEMLRSQKVVFTTVLEPNESLQKIIKEAEADYKAGKNLTVTHTDEETLAHLRSL